MRKCWNWQTGMTKDHVVLHREGSSPFFRSGWRENELEKFGFRAFFVCIGKYKEVPPLLSHKDESGGTSLIG